MAAGKFALGLFFVMLLLGVGYFSWIAVCSSQTGKLSWKPCTSLKAKATKVENLRLEYFEATDTYSVKWDPPSSFGNDDKQYANYDYYLWKGHGNYTSSTSNPPPDQKGNTKETSFVVNHDLITSGQTLTVIVVAKNRFASSPDALAYLNVPSVPRVTEVSFEGLDQTGAPVTMTGNPKVNVTLASGYGNITNQQVSVNVKPLPPQSSRVVQAEKCDPIQNDTITCDVNLLDTDLYGGTEYVPQAVVTNQFGSSPAFESTYKYVQQEIAPGSVSGIELSGGASKFLLMNLGPQAEKYVKLETDNNDLYLSANGDPIEMESGNILKITSGVNQAWITRDTPDKVFGGTIAAQGRPWFYDASKKILTDNLTNPTLMMSIKQVTNVSTGQPAEQVVYKPYSATPANTDQWEMTPTESFDYGFPYFYNAGYFN